MTPPVEVVCPWCGRVTVAYPVWHQKRVTGQPRHKTWAEIYVEAHDCEPKP